MNFHNRQRSDFSEWVIHFVHDKKPDDDLTTLADIAQMERYARNMRLPDYYDKDGKLTTKGNNLGVESLLGRAYSFYETSLMMAAEIRNKAGSEVYEGTQIVNNPGEWSCYHEEIYSHHDYSNEEKEAYIQSQKNCRILG